MYFDTKSIVECYSCGLFVKKPQDTKNILFRCPRCNNRLSKKSNDNFDALYYAISSLMLFVLLNIYPLISLNINSDELTSSLYKSVLILYQEDFFFVATIILFTLVVAPLLSSFIIIVSYLQIHTKIKILSETFLHDSFHFLSEWSFVEVFLISIIVTYIKLAGMVSSTHFEMGFYILIAYLFCFFMANVKFEGKKVFGE